MLVSHSDEPHAAEIARALKGTPTPLRSTRATAEVIRGVMRELGYARLDPETRKALQRTFQALRIAVNDEFKVLEQFLAFLPHALAPGGRVAILTFHSGEDRRVKKAFQAALDEGHFASISETPLRPGPQERHDNPRSAPAKLRWARKAR